MTASSWIALALLVILVVAGLVWLWHWLDRQRARARIEAAKSTKAEIDGWTAAALEREKQRSDEEALKTWKRHFGDPGE